MRDTNHQDVRLVIPGMARGDASGTGITDSADRTLAKVQALQELVQHYYECEWTELDWRLHKAWRTLQRDRTRRL